MIPTVSVVIPTHNRAELLRAAVTSVLKQTFRDLEIVVVDDASTDDTQEVVRRLNADDGRIRYIRHATNRREAGTRNTGVGSARANYIAFLDDDDEWLPDKLQKQVDLMAHSAPRVGAVYTGFRQIDRETGKLLAEFVPRHRGDILSELCRGNCVGTPSTVLVKRQCFENVGRFDEAIAFGPDYDMWIRIAKDFHFEYLQEPLVNYYVHKVKMSADDRLKITGLEKQIAKHGPFFARDSKSFSRRYLSLGVLYCHTGDLARGRAALVRAIRTYPLDARPYFNLLLTAAGAKNFVRLKRLKDRSLGLFFPRWRHGSFYAAIED
ncbi:MAG TPA: glycosyltransferase family 2 protein [Candidatus Acidoferrales bacterium]|nr:glycosyltransferase family 2 protein [Candidatus Acidoferrales bacterium]